MIPLFIQLRLVSNWTWCWQVSATISCLVMISFNFIWLKYIFILKRKEDNIIRNTNTYTIFIKNDIEFKKFSKKERNILPNITNKYISQCVYDEVRDPFCPVFKVGYIIDRAESDDNEKYLMLLRVNIYI